MNSSVSSASDNLTTNLPIGTTHSQSPFSLPASELNTNNGSISPSLYFHSPITSRTPQPVIYQQPLHQQQHQQLQQEQHQQLQNQQHQQQMYYQTLDVSDSGAATTLSIDENTVNMIANQVTQKILEAFEIRFAGIEASQRNLAGDVTHLSAKIDLLMENMPTNGGGAVNVPSIQTYEPKKIITFDDLQLFEDELKDVEVRKMIMDYWVGKMGTNIGAGKSNCCFCLIVIYILFHMFYPSIHDLNDSYLFFQVKGSI